MSRLRGFGRSVDKTFHHLVNIETDYYTMPDGAEHSSRVTGYCAECHVDECVRGGQGPGDLSWKWGTEKWSGV